ncbi:hypothetical protein C8R46DRAFT_396281 [Mycena filopes]|nr:hypothetical protein C8R46DRAFT_396281 [Mycena filopes]
MRGSQMGGQGQYEDPQQSYSHLRPPRTLPQIPNRPFRACFRPRCRTLLLTTCMQPTRTGLRGVYRPISTPRLGDVTYYDDGTQLRTQAEMPQPGAPRQMWSQVLDPGRNATAAPSDGRDTFVQLEESKITKAFTPQGLLSAGMQDKQDRSAKRQEELARESGASLINVPNKPPPPQTGLLGAITAHERERKREGGVGAALTEREREKRVAEDRQRRFDEHQRQQLDQMQQGGSMYGGGQQFSGYNPMMNPMMGMNPMMMGMNPMMTGMNPMMTWAGDESYDDGPGNAWDGLPRDDAWLQSSAHVRCPASRRTGLPASDDGVLDGRFTNRRRGRERWESGTAAAAATAQPDDDRREHVHVRPAHVDDGYADDEPADGHAYADDGHVGIQPAVHARRLARNGASSRAAERARPGSGSIPVARQLSWSWTRFAWVAASRVAAHSTRRPARHGRTGFIATYESQTLITISLF